MMANITKGTSFGGCIKYVLDEEKAYLLETAGIHESDPEHMISDFNLQTLLNPKVKNVLGHISLNFPIEDAGMATDDNKMLQIAHEYMEKMGIKNTQYLIARHTDKEHSHCHIIFNRVNNDGKTISDSNDRYRNEKVCKMLTAKYRLHFSDGKMNVNEESLQGKASVKYELYNAIKQTLTDSRTWKDFETHLKSKGIDLIFKFNGNTDEIQGVKFRYRGQTVSGSKIDRTFSYANLDNLFESKRIQSLPNPSPAYKHALGQTQTIHQPKQNNFHSDSSSGLSGLFSLNPSHGNTYDPMEAEFQRAMHKKKKRKKRHL